MKGDDLKCNVYSSPSSTKEFFRTKENQEIERETRRNESKGETYRRRLQPLTAVRQRAMKPLTIQHPNPHTRRPKLLTVWQRAVIRL